jgi:hypothetical protein
MHTAVMLLAADTGTADPTGGFLSYGVLGIVVVALMTGLLVPGYLYKKTEAENDRLRKLIDEKVYPTIEASTQSTKDAAETMRTVIQVLATERPAPPPRRAPARKQ